jgi:hypothetical protein
VGLCLAVAIAARPCAAADAPSLEIPIKATFLEKFGDFIAWPSGAFDRADGAILICVYGSDPFAKLADKLINGQKSAGHVISVQSVQSAEESGLCHVLYFGGGDPQTVTNILRSLRGKPILTVTDERNGTEPRGIIHFLLEENHVRFAIDDERAAANGLGISSKLLGIATSVTPRKKEGTP